MALINYKDFLMKVTKLIKGDAQLIYVEKGMAVHISQHKVKEYHGLTGTDEYKIWVGIKDRCNRLTGSHFKNYGGKGVRVCDRWNESFLAFLEDMGKRPSKQHSIDRIDNDGDYEPSNCRWATRSEQNKNKGYINKSTGHRGIYYHKGKGVYMAYAHAPRKYIGSFNTLEKAILARQDYTSGAY